MQGYDTSNTADAMEVEDGNLFLEKPIASSCCSASASTVGSTFAWEAALLVELQ